MTTQSNPLFMITDRAFYLFTETNEGFVSRAIAMVKDFMFGKPIMLQQMESLTLNDVNQVIPGFVVTDRYSCVICDDFSGSYTKDQILDLGKELVDSVRINGASGISRDLRTNIREAFGKSFICLHDGWIVFSNDFEHGIEILDASGDIDYYEDNLNNEIVIANGSFDKETGKVVFNYSRSTASEKKKRDGYLLIDRHPHDRGNSLLSAARTVNSKLTHVAEISWRNHGRIS